MNDDKIISLINELKRYDNPKGYKREYEEVKKKLEPTIHELTALGENPLDHLHKLLEHEETWSSLFALEILKEIKNPSSIPFLIEYIQRVEKGEMGDSCDDAMYALQAIGKPAVNPLLETVKKYFENKKYFGYLIGALTEIKDEQVYAFMLEVIQDYFNNYKEYDKWFEIDHFCHDFDKQGKEEVIPFLEKIYAMSHLSRQERVELKDTIEMLQDPEKYNEETRRQFEKEMPDFEDSFKKLEDLMKGKTDKIDAEEFLEKAGEVDEEFEANFRCEDCGERQNLKTGMIWDIEQEQLSFENEIMCKSCHSHHVVLSEQGKQEIMSKRLRILMGKDKGIMPLGKKIIVEDKKMNFNKSYPYILKRIKEEPNNAEIYLRAGNVAERINKYDEAIQYYKKSLESNPRLIASYVNLVEIFEHRCNYYNIKDAKQTAIFYLEKMMELFRTQNFNIATIRNKNEIVQFMGEKSESLGINFPELIKTPFFKTEKVGRNDPCPCGSGKKYKKCCMEV